MSISLVFLEVSAHECSNDNGSVCDGSDSTLYRQSEGNMPNLYTSALYTCVFTFQTHKITLNLTGSQTHTNIKLSLPCLLLNLCIPGLIY